MALVSGCISAVVAHLAEQIDGKSDSWAIAADNLDNVEIVHTGVLSLPWCIASVPSSCTNVTMWVAELA